MITVRLRFCRLFRRWSSIDDSFGSKQCGAGDATITAYSCGSLEEKVQRGGPRADREINGVTWGPYKLAENKWQTGVMTHPFKWSYFTLPINGGFWAHLVGILKMYLIWNFPYKSNSLSQWLNFKLSGITWLVGKISRFNFLSQGPLAEWE